MSEKNKKERLDILLVERGFFDSRKKAQTAIMSNCVKVAGTVINKAGTLIKLEKLEENPDTYIEVEDRSCPYVSRGAYKLEKAAVDFKINFNLKNILDIGSSTGGFTDFALQNGAKSVIALDVGKGQLDYKLRQDNRVLSLEGQNFKELNYEQLKLDSLEANEKSIDIVVADLSFISLTKILDKLKEILDKNRSLCKQADKKSESDHPVEIIFLVKPQFEAGKKIADKFQGIITDEKIRTEIVDETVRSIVESGFQHKGLVESPIKGAKGNVEYLSYFHYG